MADKCLRRLNGLVVKDAAARKDVVDLKATQERKTIRDKAVSLIAGNYKYIDCSIEAIPEETTLSGSHIFENCTILGTLFVKGGAYEFINCTFTHIRVVGATVKVRGCVGNRVNLIGNCNNSVIENSKITATIGAPIVIAGGVSDNVRICNNTLVNKLTEETSIEANCINTHGVSNSVIEGNYCESITGKNAIDISGHSTDGTIRSWNNVVRNNYVASGDIIIYAAKDIFVSNNYMPNLTISGDYTSGLDYGSVVVTGNTITTTITFRNLDPSTTATQKIYINGNAIFGSTAFTSYYKIAEGFTIYLTGNTVNKAIVASTAQEFYTENAARIVLPRVYVKIKPGSTVYIPHCYVYKSEFGDYGLPASAFFNGGFITNDSMADRYAIYGKIHYSNTGDGLWTQ